MNCPPNTNCTILKQDESTFLICFKCWNQYMGQSDYKEE